MKPECNPKTHLTCRLKEAPLSLRGSSCSIFAWHYSSGVCWNTSVPDTDHLLGISRKFFMSCGSSSLWSSFQPWKLPAVSSSFCRGGANALFHLRDDAVEIIKEALSLMLSQVILKIKEPSLLPNKALFPHTKHGEGGARSELSPFQYQLNIRGTQSRVWDGFVHITQVLSFTKLLESFPNTYWNRILSAATEHSWLLLQERGFLLCNWCF